MQLDAGLNMIFPVRFNRVCDDKKRCENLLYFLLKDVELYHQLRERFQFMLHTLCCINFQLYLFLYNFVYCVLIL